MRAWNYLGYVILPCQQGKAGKKSIAVEYVKESGQNYVCLTKMRIIDVASLMRMRGKAQSAVSIAKTEITGDVTWVDRK